MTNPRPLPLPPIPAILKALLPSLALLAFALIASPATADNAPREITLTSTPFKTPLLELYTSEGCSSCPPADRWLSKLENAFTPTFTAVPLAFHVDYWNYLGWIDPFAQAKFTQRQRRAAANNRRHTIYTPGFFVNGRETRGGESVTQSIQRANATPATAHIHARATTHPDRPNTLTAHLQIQNTPTSTNARRPSAQVYVAIFENHITRHIKAGENRGRTLEYDFVVRHWQEAMTIAHGSKTTQVSIPLGDDWHPQNLGFAVLVLDRNNGETLQAARTSLAPLFSG